MKRKLYLTVLLVFCTAILVSGCGASESKETSTETDISEEKVGQEEVVEQEETDIAENVESDETEEKSTLETYKDDYFEFEYDSEKIDYSISTEDLYSVVINAKDMPDEGDGHNTILGFFVIENTSYNMQLNTEEILEFKKTVSEGMCKELFAIDDGVSITSEGFNDTENGYEFYMNLSDGTECYVKILSLEEKMSYSICRLCPYSVEVNEIYKAIYNDARSSQKGDGQKETDYSENTEERIQKFIAGKEKNSSEVVDMIANLAKEDAVDISDEKIEEAIGYIKDNYPRYYSGAEMMELVMYYGFLLDYAYDDSEMLSELGMDVCQAVKYVYRGVETVLDDSTKENLNQIEEALEQLDN